MYQIAKSYSTTFYNILHQNTESCKLSTVEMDGEMTQQVSAFCYCRGPISHASNLSKLLGSCTCSHVPPYTTHHFLYSKTSNIVFMQHVTIKQSRKSSVMSVHTFKKKCLQGQPGRECGRRLSSQTCSGGYLCSYSFIWLYDYLVMEKLTIHQCCPSNNLTIINQDRILGNKAPGDFRDVNID